MAGNLSPQACEELIEYTADILMLVDESGTIRYESPSIQRITGYAPEERISGNAFEHVHPDDQQKVQKKFSEVVESTDNEIISTEFRFQHKDGSWIWLEVKARPQKITTIEAFALSLRDITKRKEYEQQLAQERDRLDRFASIISHDLRNPLNVIESRLHLAQEDFDSEHLDAMAGSVDRMNELIEGILTIARQGTAEMALDSLKMREVCKRCWKHIDTKAATLNVETEQTLIADESRFQQLVENLYRNAVEHGGEDVTITVGTLNNGFYIEDDGEGIREKVRDSVLEDGVSTKTDGTGLGLSIVKEIVDNHGWRLTVTEGKDGGARFEITGVETVGE